MKGALDVERGKPQEEHPFFSMKSFLIFNKIETILLVILLFLRINTVYQIMTIEENLFGLINNSIEYESGWSLFIIAGLLMVNLRTAKNDLRPIYWSTKLGGIISLLLMTNFTLWPILIFLGFTIFYYLNPPISSKFKVGKSQKVGWVSLSLIGAVMLIYLDNALYLIPY